MITSIQELFMVILEKCRNHLEDFCVGDCNCIDLKGEFAVKNFININSTANYVAETKIIPYYYNKITKKKGVAAQSNNGNKLIRSIIYKEVLRKGGNTTPRKVLRRIFIRNSHNKKGNIYQLGLRICNKNTKNYSQLKDCFDENVIEQFINQFSLEKYIVKEKEDSVTVKCKDKKSKQFEKYITFKKCGELGGNRPFVDVKLQTNSTKKINGFWVYTIVTIEGEETDNLKKVRFSSFYRLISDKQMLKRKEKSYIRQQLKLLKEKRENLAEYFYKSMFQYNMKRKRYCIRNVFRYEIDFYEVKTRKNNSLVITKQRNSNPTVMTDPCNSYSSVITESCSSNPTVMTDPCSSNPTVMTGPCSSNPTVMTDMCNSNSPIVTASYNNNSLVLNDLFVTNSPVLTNQIITNSHPYSLELNSQLLSYTSSSNSPVMTDPCNSYSTVMIESCSSNSPVMTESCSSYSTVMTGPCNSNSTVMTESCSSNSPVGTDPCNSSSTVLTGPRNCNPTVRTDPCNSYSPVMTESCSSDPNVMTESCSSNSPVRADPCNSYSTVLTGPRNSNSTVMTGPCNSNSTVMTESCSSNTKVMTDMCNSNSPVVTASYNNNSLVLNDLFVTNSPVLTNQIITNSPPYSLELNPQLLSYTSLPLPLQLQFIQQAQQAQQAQIYENNLYKSLYLDLLRKLNNIPVVPQVNFPVVPPFLDSFNNLPTNSFLDPFKSFIFDV